MKQLFLAFALLLSLIADAQPIRQGVSFFKKDSMPYMVRNNWHFHIGDSAAWVDPGYNDTSWEIVNPTLRMKEHPQKQTDSFSSIAWLRLTFFIDTALVNVPLAWTMTQYGASELFLDGKKIETYGLINGRDSSEYFDPQNHPLIVVLQHTGPHVLAVRYANYKAERMLRVYNKNFAGFRMILGTANRMVERYSAQIFWSVTLMMFMFGLFIALSLVHLFLFLYYRAARSNLYFSIFCMCLSLLFLIPYLNNFSSSPTTQLNSV